MIISGLQKLTLLDFPGKTACTVFTYGCNFRCPFCHNALLVTEKNEVQYSTEEILGFLKMRKGILDGVCITGGEPLLQKDIGEFISEIKKMGYAVKLDTNGSFPEVLESIINAGIIDYVAMDIKNRKEKYSETVGISVDIKAIEKSVEILKRGRVDYEFRTTVSKEFHTADDIISIAKWISGNSKYFLQQYVPSDNLIGEELTAYSKEEMLDFMRYASEFAPKTEVRGV